ncbi:hypothetical protein GOV03_05205 [Candidatus Woesearchaeota archaeon]|nr:hypothetical protein [Candidatus Woesearchaeota archaeon]
MMLWIVGGILIIWLAVNFYFRYQTFKSLAKTMAKKKWDKLSKKEYANKCYHLVANKFTRVNKCWLKYPWKNFYYTNIWKLKKDSVPCLIQNKLFQRCLSKKFHKDEIKTKIDSNFEKGIGIHFYSNIKINGKWVDVDVWGKKWHIPFGKNIHNVKLWGEK